MAAKKRAAAKRSTTSRAPTRAAQRAGSVQKFLDQTGRNENDVVRFSDLRALEGYSAGDTPSPAGDGTDGADAGAETPAS